MLRDDINNALKDAMKAGDAPRVSTLRLVNSRSRTPTSRRAGRASRRSTDEDAARRAAEDDQAAPGIGRAYQKGGRPELAAQERDEIEIISAYLPQQMSDDEVGRSIAALVKETGATGMKDMGKVMAALKERYAGKIDFAKASAAVKKMLSGG